MRFDIFTHYPETQMSCTTKKTVYTHIDHEGHKLVTYPGPEKPAHVKEPYVATVHALDVNETEAGGIIFGLLYAILTTANRPILAAILKWLFETYFKPENPDEDD